jgi:hypothetical protein
MNLQSDPSQTAKNQILRLPRHDELVFDWAYEALASSAQILYTKNKYLQLDAAERIDWQQGLDQENSFSYDDRLIPLSGTETLTKASSKECAGVRHQYQAYMVKQFLHGERAALRPATRLVQVLPDDMAKQMAAQQVADEARHIEVFERLIRERINFLYPADTGLKALIEVGLCDSRRDFLMLPKPNYKGWVMRGMIFRPVCFGIGLFAKALDWQDLWRVGVTPVRVRS